jgi:hypothetical protein
VAIVPSRALVVCGLLYHELDQQTRRCITGDPDGGKSILSSVI